MFPYWLLFTLCAAGAVQYRPDLRRRAHGGALLGFVSFVALVLIGFRYEVGGDWGAYLGIFEQYEYAGFAEAVFKPDPGFAVLNWMAQQVGADIWLVNLVCAALFMWGLTQFSRQQPNPWLAILVAVPYLIIVVAMGYTRQAVAIGLILAGMARLREHQSMVRFAVYILLAALFHRTAVVVLPLVALAATRNRFAIAGLGAAMAATLYYAFLNADMDRLVENYVVEDYDSQGAAIRVAMNLVPAALFLIFPRRFALDEFERKLWRNFSYASWVALGMLLLMSSSTVIDRLALYLIPLQLFVFSRLPFAFSRTATANGPLTLGVIGYSALVQFVWLTSASHADYWLPYRFYPL